MSNNIATSQRDGFAFRLHEEKCGMIYKAEEIPIDACPNSTKTYIFHNNRRALH